ncbi:MAG: replicative DNA helicase, partial [Minisyncoccia bacterium]
MDAKININSSIKIPPQNIEAEQMVLGSLLLDKNVIIKIADLLAPEDFYNPAHEKIYRTILELYEKHQPVDILTVANKLKEKKLLIEIGGSSYLAEITNLVTTTSHADYYAQIVKEKKVLRDLINVSAEITEKAFEPSKEFEIFLDEIEQKILSISQKSLPQNFTHIKEELVSAYERIEKLHEKKGLLRGLSTGFIELDNILSGLQKSDFIIIGARPSLGKTSFALDIARNVALKEQVPVGIFSLEMSREQVVDRIIAAQSNVPLWKLRTGKISDDLEFQMIQKALDDLSKTPIFIDDTPSPNILQMRSMARRLQVERGLGLIIVDYLQLIAPRHSSNQSNMVQQVTEISRGLKGLARELNVPLIAISQLSRSVDKRDNRVPQLSDLRESGCLSADATIMNALTGELVTIKDLAENKTKHPFFVYTLNDNWKLEIKKVTKAFSSGYKKIYELKTKTGQTIKASANHPFRKLNQWARLDELKIGDRIALPRK